MSVVPSSLDSSTRDVPPSTLAPDEKVEQPSVGTLCVTDRQETLASIGSDDNPAAERTGPLPLDKARDQKVLCLYYGLDGGRHHTLKEIGAIIGVSITRVRNIRDRALKNAAYDSWRVRGS